VHFTTQVTTRALVKTFAKIRMVTTLRVVTYVPTVFLITLATKFCQFSYVYKNQENSKTAIGTYSSGQSK
jgi:hypothetical protein